MHFQIAYQHTPWIVQSGAIHNNTWYCIGIIILCYTHVTMYATVKRLISMSPHSWVEAWANYRFYKYIGMQSHLHYDYRYFLSVQGLQKQFLFWHALHLHENRRLTCRRHAVCNHSSTFFLHHIQSACCLRSFESRLVSQRQFPGYLAEN